MHKDSENIEDLKEALNADNPAEKDWDNLKEIDYRKAHGKQRKKPMTHLTPKKKKRKK